MSQFKSFRSVAGVFLSATALSVFALPGVAQAGFFEQLFGASPAPVAPVYSYERPAPSYESPVSSRNSSARRAQRAVPHIALQYHGPKHSIVAHLDGRTAHVDSKVAHVDGKPELQKTTDLMSDKTLRAGDAVMMKDGIHIYDGGGASKHKSSQFVALDDSHDVKQVEKSALFAMDTTRNDPLRAGIAPDTLASGRSAAVGTPVVAGFKITDARGQQVRYVGP